MICNACQANGPGYPRYCSCCGRPLESPASAVEEIECPGGVQPSGPQSGSGSGPGEAPLCRSCGAPAPDGRDHCEACEAMLATALRAHPALPTPEPATDIAPSLVQSTAVQPADAGGIRPPVPLGADDAPDVEQAPLPWWKARRPSPEPAAALPVLDPSRLPPPPAEPVPDPWSQVAVAVAPPDRQDGSGRAGGRAARGASSWKRPRRLPVRVSPGWGALTIAASLAALVVSVWGADLPRWLPPVALGRAGTPPEEPPVMESGVAEPAPSPAPGRAAATSTRRGALETSARVGSSQGATASRATPPAEAGSGPSARRQAAARPRVVAQPVPRASDPVGVPREAPTPTLPAASLTLATVPAAVPSLSAPASPPAEGMGSALAFEITQVDVRPQVERRVDPDYGHGASDGASPEVVVLRVLVSAAGTPSAVRVLRRSRFGPIADDAAVAAVRQWRFSPARKRDQAVDCWFNVGVPLRASDTDGSP